MNRESYAEKECFDQPLGILLQEEDSQESRRVASHVETCAHCQRRLEQLAAEEELWHEAKSVLTDQPLSDPERSERADFSKRHPGRKRHEPWSDSLVKQMLAPPSHPEMLGRVGRYEVERLIGSGGMGIVLKGFDSELNRPVAIKVLAPHLAGSAAARARFHREARAAAAVVHEHVVAIHNVESDGQAPFLVMQYVAGESLQQRLDREGTLSFCEILRITMQTASGLAAAHAQGLIHRDVKPSNILLEQGVERALLTDFGLARASDEASLTQTGCHPGTPKFMSPEQARGEDIDTSSDLFSLGSVIYMMCTGRPPFRAETSYGVLRRITDDTPRPVREINPELPEWFQGMVMRLLEKQPQRRFRSAQEVHDLFEQCLAHVQRPTTVPLPSACQNYVEMPRRKDFAWWAIPFLLICLLTASLFLSEFLMPARGTSFDTGNVELNDSQARNDASAESNPTAAMTQREIARDPIVHWDDTADSLGELRSGVADLESQSQLFWNEDVLHDEE